MSSTRKIISSANVRGTPLPLSQAVLVDKTLYISGQLGIDKEGVLASGIEEQTRQTLENIGHILVSAGASFKNVVKTTVLLSDITQFQQMNKAYGEYFTERFPARMAFQVAALPIPAALVEIEAVAVIGDIVEGN